MANDQPIQRIADADDAVCDGESGHNGNVSLWMGVVGRHFPLEAVLAPRESLVRGEDDKGVIELVGLLQRDEEPADAVVEAVRGAVK